MKSVIKLMPRTVAACAAALVHAVSAFAGQWTYDSTNNRLSHDESVWVLNVWRSGTNLTVTGGYTPPSTPSALPLDDAVGGGYRIIGIGGSAFSGCVGLTGVTIGSGVTDIGYSAFSGCTNLTRVEIGSGVTSIGEWVFDGCLGIRELVLNMPTVPQGFASAFFKQGWYNYETGEFEVYTNGPTVSTNGVSIIFGDNVTNIEAYAFSNTVGPTNVVFGAGAVEIGEGAFQRCVGLTSVAFGLGTVTINGYGMFSDCNELTDIVFGTGTVTINGGFNNCAGLANIVFGSGTVNVNWGFQDCDRLTNLVFGSGAVNIDGGFYYCDGLTNINFGSGVTNIGYYAFSECAGLTNIVIGSSVTGIGDGAFEGCSGLTAVTIPGNVTSVGEAPFDACSSLTNISVAAENPVCRDIGGVLYSKDAATLLTFPAGRGGEYAIPDGTACLGQDAFSGSALTSLRLPASVTNAGGKAWSPELVLFNNTLRLDWSGVVFAAPYMTNISVAAGNPVYRDIDGVLYSKDAATLLAFPAGRGGNYTVPSGVSRIGNRAFAGCESLTGVTFPDSVTTIGESAFWYCSGLMNIVFGTGTVNIGNAAFFRCGVTSVAFPDSVSSIGDGAFYECANLANVVFGAGVTNIGYGAFGDCAGLATVTIGPVVTRVGDCAFACYVYQSGSLTNAVMSNVRVMGPNTFGGQPLAEVVFTGAEPPRIVEEWSDWNGVENTNCLADVAADWTFSTWQDEGHFTVLVPAAYAGNWGVTNDVSSTWRGRPIRTLENARGISGTFDFAVDDRRGLEWTTAEWFAQSAVRCSGPMALQSGDIVNGQTSTVQTIVKNAGTLTFRYRVSSEEEYDFLNVYLDGALVLQDSGERSEWPEARIVVHGTGKHKIRWDYVKDDSYSEGVDCAWIDAVVWEPGTIETEVPVPYTWLDRFGLAEGSNYEAAAFADADDDGYPAWEEYVAGTDPTNGSSVLTAFLSMRDGVPTVTWAPDLRPARVYTVEGKTSLASTDWQSPTNATHRFFRVNVSMP